MKKLIMIIIFICFSCQEKQVNISCTKIEKKYDSILNKNEEFKSTTIFKFYKILSKEKGTPIDSLLIEDYKNLKGKDSLIDLYIWDRIHTTNQNIMKFNVYKEFKGTYVLKSYHNKKYAQATKIKIDNDSCYIFKYNDLLVSDKFKLRNSSNKYIKGKIILKNYRLYLDGAIKSNLAIDLEDNGCMDCEQLQFFKTK